MNQLYDITEKLGEISFFKGDCSVCKKEKNQNNLQIPYLKRKN